LPSISLANISPRQRALWKTTDRCQRNLFTSSTVNSVGFFESKPTYQLNLPSTSPHQELGMQLLKAMREFIYLKAKAVPLLPCAVPSGTTPTPAYVALVQQRRAACRHRYPQELHL